MTKISLHGIELAGFRAYLAQQTIELQSKNLAIFAPNGRGKSSLADAIEFYLAPTTTLPRFGDKAVGNQAGYTAMAHSAAEGAGIKPSVVMNFRAGREAFGSARHPDGKMPRTEAGNRVAAQLRVHAVVRGHELRGFVEDTSPDQRYTQVSEWLSLSALTEAQKAIKSLRDQVATDIKDTGNKVSIERRLARVTGDSVRSWNSVALQTWVRTTHLKELGLEELKFEFEPESSLTATLWALVRDDEAKVGLTSLKQRLAAIQKITAQPDDVSNTSTGSLAKFEAANALVASAAAHERVERANAAESTFHDVWSATEQLLCSDDVAQDACPICNSAWADTPGGSRSITHAFVKASLESLKSYDEARRAHLAAKHSLASCSSELERTLAECSMIFRTVDDRVTQACDAANARIAKWLMGDVLPDMTELTATFGATTSVLAVQIQAAQQKQNDQAPAKALSTFEQLVEIYKELEVDRLQRKQLSHIGVELEKQAAFVGGQIRAHITELLDELRHGTNDIYKAIQGVSAANVRLELPKETDKLQNRLGILVDFAENRRGVAPSGYLSDSQLHSVALALRLAAVRRFNPGFPLLVLDDISTSYDADYRRHLVAALKTHMGDCQLIILTHDERFYTYLREMLPQAEWGFKQINSLDPGHGPRLASHLVKDEEVDKAWTNNKSAANLIRQIEEETLLQWAQDFEVDIRIRKSNRPFDYGRAELASAIARYFKDVGIKPPRVEGVFNPFLDSIVAGNVENFGSHFQDGPWGDVSLGDEKARWKEFKAFRSALCCPQCQGTRFRRPHPHRFAVCARRSCEAQFRFAEPGSALP